MLNIHFI